MVRASIIVGCAGILRKRPKFGQHQWMLCARLALRTFLAVKVKYPVYILPINSLNGSRIDLRGRVAACCGMCTERCLAFITQWNHGNLPVVISRNSMQKLKLSGQYALLFDQFHNKQNNRECNYKPNKSYQSHSANQNYQRFSIRVKSRKSSQSTA